MKLLLFQKVNTIIINYHSKSNGNNGCLLNTDILGSWVVLPGSSDQQIQSLHKAIYSLSVKGQLIFFLAKECSFKIAEIAELTHLSVQCVEKELVCVLKTFAETFYAEKKD